ncbi:FAD-dependent oxidoreductase [Streptomyces sp. NPDC093261]|uniref:FAD-dependent oxidoreductase n=1 Tax=Streptomyces sp. NPDC093261 TaxID=3366037 RepID=UPI00380F0FA6
MATATTAPAHHPIAVVGAGLGGLVAARVLQVHGIEAAVYERDASPAARPQGGMLDIHEESGQAALRAAGLLEEFRAIIHSGGEEFRVLDPDGTVRFKDAEEAGRPEVDRNDLRRVLLDSLPEGTVRWGAKVTGARPLGDGRHEVTLADGTVFTTDLLIGADGAWSRIRPLLSPAVPAYAGVSFVETDLYEAAVGHPATAELLGGGMTFALADGKGFLTHLETDGSIHAYVAFQAPEDWLSGLDFTRPESVKEALLAHFEGWDDRLRALIADADDAPTPRPIHTLPVGHRWAHTPGVTLLGDAAHLMSPFAGEGANAALQDGAELATALAANPDSFDTGLLAYEKALFPRAEHTAAQSAQGLDLLFGPDATENLVAMMSGQGDRPGTAAAAAPVTCDATRPADTPAASTPPARRPAGSR